MNKKIIACAPLPPPHGGITNWYRILASQAQKNGVELITVNTSPNVRNIQRSLFSRVVIQGFRMLFLVQKLRKIIKQNTDVSVAHLATSGQIGFIRDVFFLRLLKKKGIKTVYHFHFGRVPEILERRGTEYKLLKKTVALADNIIAIDPNTRDSLKKHFADKTVYYIPNPVDVAESAEKAPEKKKIVYLGMVYREKGIEELLSAWSELSEKYPDWSLKIIGRFEDNYKKYLDTHFPAELAEFKGYTPHDEAIDMLSESAFLVLPSYTEGFPNVVIEAMMCEKAVVATNVGAIPDILSDGCGIVISPKNVKELRDSMEKLMLNDELRKAMGVNGRTKVLSNYNSDLIFKKYTEIWESLGSR